MNYRYKMETCLTLDFWSHDRHAFLVKYLDNAGNLGCTMRRKGSAGPNRVFMSAMCIKKKAGCC